MDRNTDNAVNTQAGELRDREIDELIGRFIRLRDQRRHVKALDEVRRDVADGFPALAK